MAIRTHLGRDFDLRLPSNLLLFVTVGLSAVAAALIWLNGELSQQWLAPGASLAYWVLAREIDPEHWWTATLASVFAATWTLFGYEVVSLLAIGALAIAARLMSGSTGRRPLISDLLVVGAGGIAIGYTFPGWVGGFWLAIAIVIDWKARGSSSKVSPTVAAATAIGTTLVAAAAAAFPLSVPDVDRIGVLLVGALTLTLIVRDTNPLVSVVDARHGATLDVSRVHVARIAVGLGFFLITLGDGIALATATPLIVTLGLVAFSNELSATRT